MGLVNVLIGTSDLNGKTYTFDKDEVRSCVGTKDEAKLVKVADILASNVEIWGEDKDPEIVSIEGCNFNDCFSEMLTDLEEEFPGE